MEPHDTPARAPPPRRTPKPSQRLDADAQRILGLVLGRVDIEHLAAMACQSESTIRRFADGATGARASVRMLTQAIVVTVCERAPDVAAVERETLVRLASASTPGGVGLHLPLLMDAPVTHAGTTKTATRRRVVAVRDGW